MKFNAVVFDMDGVMFDTESVCMKAWDTVGEEMGIGKAGYMVYKTLGMTEMRRQRPFISESAISPRVREAFRLCMTGEHR